MSNQSISSAANTLAEPLNVTSLEAVGKIFVIAIQYALLILLVKEFSLQDDAFIDLSYLVLCGFLIHAFLPIQYRLIFFTLLSMVGITVVLGFSSGIWLLILGLILIGICHLPIPFKARIAVLIITALILSYLRLNWRQHPALDEMLGGIFRNNPISVPWPAAVWPILGSMFLFRLIVYLHDLYYSNKRPGWTQTLSYFFMIPNVCFPLFPVVDYTRFSQDYYNENPYRIYQRGIAWIFRGITHLIVYRFVYLHMTIDPLEVDGLADMLQFSITAFLLYLRVSGQFHIAAGILLLFGFNLPETNHLYFLASSFNNHWRRINIYWKDFMMKVFYYPLFFRLRKLGNASAIAIATMLVFFTTWFLHMYQWFWLRGTVLFEWHDALFWGILGILVVINSLYEVKHGRDRSLGKRIRTFYDRAGNFFSISATFLSISLLWGMWSSDSLSQWFSMWQSTGLGWLFMLILIPSLYASAMLMNRLAKKFQKQETTPTPQVGDVNFWRAALLPSLAIIAIFMLANTTVHSFLPTPLANAFAVVQSSAKLNNRAATRLQMGYYENLVGGVRQNPELWSVYQNQPADWQQWQSGSMRATHNLLEYEMMPNIDTVFKGKRVTTNQWGMRDQDYKLNPAPNTYRIALLGASAVFGSGVTNEEIFEAILENQLNKESHENEAVEFQILNFSKFARVTLQQPMVLEKMVLPFKPDTLLLVVHQNEAWRSVQLLAKLAHTNRPIPYPYLRSTLKRAGIRPGMNIHTIEKRLKPYADEILTDSYRHITKICRDNDIKPFWVFMPITYERFKAEEIADDIAAAKALGFQIIDLRDVYDQYTADQLAVAEWDRHPNALAHRLIADRLLLIFHEQNIVPLLPHLTTQVTPEDGKTFAIP